MPKTIKKKKGKGYRVKCDVCGKVLKEESRFYVVSYAYVIQNDQEEWDYERKEDDSVYCLKCGGKALPRVV